METEQKAISEIWTFVHSFMEIYRKEKDKLPYHINVIDLLHANENAHSRILMKLLQFNRNGKFEILQSFLSYLHLDLPINKPKITTEVDRIDLRIFDKGFAIIIENKIHGATDQPEQIKRYIDKVSAEYKKEQIYVLYLIRDEGKDVSDQSWGEYKEQFDERFRVVSFRDDILPWLKDFVMPECRAKDVYLLSAIEQYIDHLEGLFNTRKIQTKMNEELQNDIQKQLRFGTSPDENHANLLSFISDLEKVKDQLGPLKNKIERECFEEWRNRLSRDFPRYEIMDKIDDRGYPSVGVNITYRQRDIGVQIQKDNEDGADDIYYGICKEAKDDGSIESLLHPLMDGFRKTDNWYGIKNTSFKNGYKRLADLIKEVENLLKTQEL